MSPLSARARVFLFLLVVAAPVTATLAIEHAARPPAIELRKPGHESTQGATGNPGTAADRTEAARRSGAK